MGLVDAIKNQAAKSGAGKAEFVYFKPGVKNRFRFLEELDEGLEVLFHDGFNTGIQEPCQELFNRKCKHHEDEDLVHKERYAFSVYNLDTKKTQIIMEKANNCSPLPQLVGFYETYKTITDRDYVITQNGSGTTKSFSVVPMDKSKFKNDKVKPFSKEKKLKLIDKAFPADEDSSDDEDKQDYSDMSAKELYDLCQEREIECEKRKAAKYYIELLEKADEEKASEGDDWGDDEEEAPNYDDMTPKELYQLCKEKDMDVEPKKSREYYIKALKETEDSDDESTGDGDDW